MCTNRLKSPEKRATIGVEIFFKHKDIIMDRLPRKIDTYLEEWQKDPRHLPLIVKGARQVGKTEAIRHFAKSHYAKVLEINFALQKQYRGIFDNGFDVDSIIKSISVVNPDFEFIPGATLIFFDELQDCINAATSLKSFREDGRYDVICSGSLMGINYKEIESNSVGNKQDYELRSLDFEEFLWAKGYKPEQIEDMYSCTLDVKPLPQLTLDVMFEHFRDYMILGGMPAIVNTFVAQKNFSGTLKMQQQILLDYREDITKYADGMDQARILNAYNKIPVFLGKDNKKFQVSKVSDHGRNRDYVGVIEWLQNAGIINVCYCLEQVALPLKGNYNPDNYRVYFADTGLLIGSLDEDAQMDLRYNRNFNTYKGAIYENIVADELTKQGFQLYFYRNEKSTVEMDFFVRDQLGLIPIEVKSVDGPTASLNRLVEDPRYPDIRYGIKLGHKNIGFNGKFYTFPYFLTFLLRRWLREKYES